MPQETAVAVTGQRGEEVKKEWSPSDTQTARIKFVYKRYAEMKEIQDAPYPQFNDRTLKEFIDDSEKRMNAYVLDKASQGKEDWQANFSSRAYAKKAKGVLAGHARDIPEMH